MNEEMFTIDLDANAELILAEEQRRRDLIDSAVKSFAPALADRGDVKVIHLHSTNAALRKLIRDELAHPLKCVVVEHCIAGKRARTGVNEVPHEGMILPIPKTADLVITKTNINFRQELFAAQLKAQLVVLPEGMDYLRKRLEVQGALVVVGAEQGRI